MQLDDSPDGPVARFLRTSASKFGVPDPRNFSYFSAQQDAAFAVAGGGGGNLFYMDLQSGAVSAFGAGAPTKLNLFYGNFEVTIGSNGFAGGPLVAVIFLTLQSNGTMYNRYLTTQSGTSYSTGVQTLSISPQPVFFNYLSANININGATGTFSVNFRFNGYLMPYFNA